jgi:hypothetical protein
MNASSDHEYVELRTPKDQNVFQEPHSHEETQCRTSEEDEEEEEEEEEIY